MMSLNDIEVMNGGGGGGGGNSFALTNAAAPSQLVGENVPTQKFDISVLSGLKPSDKYLGKNRVSDIQEAYQTYITGSPIGKGGQYAVDAARKYGTTITEAARGYLVGVGLPTLANLLPGGGSNTTTPDDTVKKLQDTNDSLQKQIDELKKSFDANDTVKVLSDSIKSLFGNAVALSPLQSQATGYTPVTASSPLATGETGGGGSSIGLLVILGVVGVIGYFLYKRYAS